MASFLHQWTPSVLLPRSRGNNIFLIFNFGQAASSTFAIFTFMVSTLLTFIQIKFPAVGTLTLPFETHHTKFMVAILSLLAFCCFAIGATQNLFPNQAPKLFMAIKCTASLSVASLVSLLLPQPWDQVPYVTYFLYACHCLGLLRIINLAYYHEIAYGFVRSSRARLQQLRQTRRPPLPLTVRDISNNPIANRPSITEVRTVH